MITTNSIKKHEWIKIIFIVLFVEFLSFLLRTKLQLDSYQTINIFNKFNSSQVFWLTLTFMVILGFTLCFTIYTFTKLKELEIKQRLPHNN